MIGGDRILVRQPAKDIGVEIYDISQILSEGIAVWPGDPEFRHRTVARMKDGGSSNVSAVEMGAHTGTHIDAPFHLDERGIGIADMPLFHFIGPARVFSLSNRERISAADLSSLDWRGVERALFRTRAVLPAKPAFDSNYACLDEDAAEFLVKQRILLVGTDAPSVDAFDSIDLPSHRKLLRQGIAILEGARLAGVPPGDYELICLPLRLAGFDGSPVRALLRKD